MDNKNASRHSVVYVARVTHRSSLGIIYKVKNTVAAFNDLGHSARLQLFHEYWQRGIIKVALSIITSTEELIILRSDHHGMIFHFIPMVIARLKGQRIIIDVANPVGVGKNEIEKSYIHPLKKRLKTLLLHLSYPLVFWPANRLLEYGDEDPRFVWGVSKKVRLVGNGIRVDSVIPRTQRPTFDGTRLVFASAGHIAFWHGFDRLIRSIADYNARAKGSVDWIRFEFRIIGNGFEMENLAALVRQLGLEEQISFFGVLDGEQLADVFSDAHVGICNLAQYRKGLYINSELKTRDFCARGIPFVLACPDTDFDSAAMPFVYEIPNDNSPLPLAAIAAWYRELDSGGFDFSVIRHFAQENLDFSVKVEKDYLSVFDG